MGAAVHEIAGAVHIANRLNRANVRHGEAAMITIHIPVPPSTNNLFANVAKRGRVRSERYNAWLRVAGTELNLQRPQPIAGLVSVDLMMKRPNASSDIDNRIKAALDLLVLHRLIEDDKNIVDVRARWGAVDDCIVTVKAA